MFSNELLTRAIRVNDRLLKDFVDLYFRQAFEAFCGSQKQVDQMLRQAHHLTSMLPSAASSVASLCRGCLFPLPFGPLRFRPVSQMRDRVRCSAKRGGSASRERFRN